MSTEFLFLTGLGFLVGIFAGLLGVGGGILMVPALVFLPALWGMPPYTVHMATGVSVVQSLVGGISSFWTHYRKGTVFLSLIGSLLMGSLIGGFLGGVVSGLLPDIALYVLFAWILITVLVLAFMQPHSDSETATSNDAPMSHPLPFFKGLLTGGGISFLAANTGIGGAVLLTPILIYVQHIPTRLAIGAGATFVVVTPLSATVGKWVMHLIPLPDVLWVSLGALFGGAIGAQLSHKLPTVVLQKLLMFFVITALIRICYEIMRLV